MGENAFVKKPQSDVKPFVKWQKLFPLPEQTLFVQNSGADAIALQENAEFLREWSA